MNARLDLIELLANHLEKNVRDDEWNMEVWNQETECGTVGCAIGHACRLPEFQAAGLCLATHPDSKGCYIPLYLDEFRLLFGMTAVGACLQINGDIAQNLFLPQCYRDEDSRETTLVSRQEVVGRLRNFMKKHKQEAESSKPGERWMSKKLKRVEDLLGKTCLNVEQHKARRGGETR